MRSLHSKMLWRIGIAVVISFLLSAGFMFYYYKTILEKQLIRDDQAKLKQTARQLQYMSDDIANFSISLLVSDQLQNFFKSYGTLNVYDTFVLTNEVMNYLRSYKVLRKEVMSFTLVLPDGEALWSESPNDGYMTEHLREPWYRNYRDSGLTSAFSEPHLMYSSAPLFKKRELISYIIEMKDIRVPGKVIGELILNMDYSVFASLLQSGGEGFDAMVWTKGSKQILYENTTSSLAASDLLADMKDVGPQESGAYIRRQGGYLFKEHLAGTNLILIAFTSNRSLVVRSQYVIYLLFVFSLTATILILLLMMPAIFKITKPLLRLSAAMRAVSNGNLQTVVSIRTGDELERLGNGFNRMIEQLNIHLQKSVRFEHEKREMELDLLISQINPHFIYNTLNTVIYMAQKQGNEEISHIVGSLINILQDTVKLGRAQRLIPLSEEIRILKDYAMIQSYRYLDMFDIEWQIDEAALDCLVPASLIQPLVENAIFHGICPKNAKGTICLSASVGNGRLTITVADDGVGIEADKLAVIWHGKEESRDSGLRHIGLANTRKRLDYFMGEGASLRIESAVEQGTTVAIVLPELRAT